MFNKEQISKCKSILINFGLHSQVLKLEEEAKELNEANQEEDIQHIIEEIADLKIVFKQLELAQVELIRVGVQKASKSRYYGGNSIKMQEDIDEMIDKKLDRTLERIASGYYKEKNKR